MRNFLTAYFLVSSLQKYFPGPTVQSIPSLTKSLGKPSQSLIVHMESCILI